MSADHNAQQQSWQNGPDGHRVLVSHHTTQSSYICHGPGFPVQRAPVALAPPEPSFQRMHQIMHLDAMQHHRSVMQHFDAVHQSMQDNMLYMGGYPLGQAQMQHHMPMSSLAMQPPAMLHHRTTEAPTERNSSDDEDSSNENDDQSWHLLQQQLDLQLQLQETQQQTLELKRANDKRELESQRVAMEQRYRLDQDSIKRQGAKMDARLAKLEANETKSRTEQDAKDVELRRLREENNRLAQQQYHDAVKHKAEMAELARLSAEGPASVHDTSALERLVREIQAQQLSKSDVEGIIQDRVSSQLQGVAKKKDLEAAGSKMQNALQHMPPGASIEQIQSAVNQELGKAVSAMSSKMAKQRNIEPTEAVSTRGVAQLRPINDDASTHHWPQLMPAVQPVPAVQHMHVKGSSSRRHRKALVPIIEEAPTLIDSSSKPKNTVRNIMPVIAEAPTALADSRGHSIANFPGMSNQHVLSMPEEYILPTDFPDTASQISGWERGRAAKGLTPPASIPQVSGGRELARVDRLRKSSKK